MGKLKPIGSEKLEGMAKINRMIELARYKENKPQIVNENSSNEYSIKLADGHKYFIVKEKSGYVLKKGLNENVNEYVEPMQHRKHYSSYSQALKRLNIITKEVNNLEGVKKNVSLFTEGEEGEKKYFLRTKRNTNEQAPPTQKPSIPAPAPAPAASAPAPSPEADSTTPSLPPAEPPTDTETTDVPSDEMDTDTGDEMGSDTEETPTEKEGSETVTFKTIQKLTGKLAQKLRTLGGDEENEMSSKDIKYVINSILSAIDLEKLEDDDKEEVIMKIEGDEEEDEEEVDSDEVESSDEEPDMTGDEVETETPKPPTKNTEEVPEYYDSIDEEDNDDFGNMYFQTSESMKGFEHNESNKMEEMIENIFSESKVDKILKKYFKLNESEIKSKSKKDIGKTIDSISENIVQRVSARKFLNEYKSVKFLGKNKNKELVFSLGGVKHSITKKGDILI